MASESKQVCLVIGASRGIGRQVAVDLAKHGYYGKSGLKSKTCFALSPFPSFS